MRFITELGIPLPKEFSAAAEFVLNHQLRRALEQPAADRQRLLGLLEAARLEGVLLDTATLEFAYRQALEHSAEAFLCDGSVATLEQFYEAAGALEQLPFSIDLWKVQNRFYDLLERRYTEEKKVQASGDEKAGRWIAAAQKIARLLRVRLPA